MRPHVLTLSAFALAVVFAAGMGIASGDNDEDGWHGAVLGPEKRLNVSTMTVDGEVFEVWTPVDHPNQRNFDWISGPNKGYGFGESGPDKWTRAMLEEAIRTFLSMIDPETGYIEED